MSAIVLQGRVIEPNDTATINALVELNPGWSRRRLSLELCQQWNWRNAAGQIKDMAARTLLAKLEQRGLIRLPARRQVAPKRMSGQHIKQLQWDQEPVEGHLSSIKGLHLQEVSSQPDERKIFASALSQFHYLGFKGTVGENLQYMVRNGEKRLLACLLFGSSAWKSKDRDQWIGWNIEQRQRNLNFTTNNNRFLILPWVKVPHLASWILGQALRRLSTDWQAKYGHPIVMVETFVERDRFKGTAYQAANWIKVGSTTGRTRQDRNHQMQCPVKDIYVYRLQKRFRERLAQ